MNIEGGRKKSKREQENKYQIKFKIRVQDNMYYSVNKKQCMRLS